jgi:hypothetical protein
VKGIDPETGHHFDDTRRYVDQVKSLGRRRSPQDLRGQRDGASIRAWTGQLKQRGNEDMKESSADFERVSPTSSQAAGTFAASILADVAGPPRHGRRTRGARSRPRCACRARPSPSRCAPATTLMIHTADGDGEPGDVLVEDGKGDRTCALMGSIMINACKKLGPRPAS